MKRFLLSGLLYCLPVFLPAQQVLTLNINGTINPVSATYIHKGIEKARLGSASCVLLHLNTPGGLLSSTRDIVSDILQSPVPVIVFVAPSGAQSGSAGVFITMAAHIAAMAPGTNIGAAHPVNMEGGMDSVMSKKVTNDAAAFIRSIAEKRNRNLQWAEDAVVKSLSITETEAIQKNVIDEIAANDRDLLNKIDGKNMQLASGTTTLHTKDARIEVYEMS
jgi:membrane-bound serine protease (ClpP class)